MSRRTGIALALAAVSLGAVLALWRPASAQQGGPPPAVGVVPVVKKPVTPTSEHIGKIQAQQRVNLVARVSAFLDEQHFVEGSEVKKGDLLYRLEQGPFLADVAAKEATIKQLKAQLQNANVTLERARTLIKTPAGLQSALDAALANQLALEAQVQGAEAQLQASQISLAYTEIRAPIGGKIGRTSVTPGNYVSPGSGVLATIVSQDPMYVVFPLSTRAALDLRARNAKVVIKVRLPDGRMFEPSGALDFVDNSIAANTDTIVLRATIPNPPLPRPGLGIPRELFDGELITVILQDAEPVETASVPRASILADRQGNYVYVVDADSKAQVRRVELGQSTPAVASVTSGLTEGESVIVEGIQRVRPGQKVAPGPASADAFPPDRARGTALEDAGGGRRG
jgi:membrane fusion protein (multidrug efflux system)